MSEARDICLDALLKAPHICTQKIMSFLLCDPITRDHFRACVPIANCPRVSTGAGVWVSSKP